MNMTKALIQYPIEGQSVGNANPYGGKKVERVRTFYTGRKSYRDHPVPDFILLIRLLQKGTSGVWLSLLMSVL